MFLWYELLKRYNLSLKLKLNLAPRWEISCADHEGGGGGGGPDPQKNHKNIGPPNNTGPDPLKIHNVTNTALNVGPTSAASETPIKWRFAGGPMITRL